jgi:hypothetical protein
MNCERESENVVLKLKRQPDKPTTVWHIPITKRNAADEYQAVVFAAFTAFLFKDTLGGGVSMLKCCSSE